MLSQLCSLVHCYKQDKAALQKNGFNTGGLTSADGTILVVTVSGLYQYTHKMHAYMCVLT